MTAFAGARLSDDDLWIPDRALLRRAPSLIEIKQRVLGDIGPVCDIGDPSPMTYILRGIHASPVVSISGLDLDREHIPMPVQSYVSKSPIPYSVPRGWRVIYCLEVLEHLMNPLFFLEGVRAAMACSYLDSMRGVLVITTPISPRPLWGAHHFHEIDDTRLEALADKAGFDMVGGRRISIRNHLSRHIGLRPLMRLFKKTRLYLLYPRYEVKHFTYDDRN